MPGQRSASDRDRQLEELIRRYGRLIASAVGRSGPPGRDALKEDAAQEVAVALWRRLRNEQPIHNPTSYIYRTAVREALRLLRREQARGEEELEEAAGAAHSLDPERSFEMSELRGKIEACLTTLSADRERAVRAHLSGFAVQEIMKLYGWPYQRARNLISRGMADLRAALRRQGIDG